MTARYLFFLNVEYAFSILRPLQTAIRNRGGKTAWFLHDLRPALLHADEVRLDHPKAVQRFQPEAVFVPGNWVPHFFPGIKVQLFHGFGIEKKGHFDIRGFFDLYCTHGPLTTRPFEALARKHRYFRAIETGWPKVDPLFLKRPSTDWKKRHGIERPVVLYAPTFSPALTSAPALRPTIERLSRTGRLHWLIKFHPLMDPEIIHRYRRLQSRHLTIIDDHDIIPWLHAADVMLTDTSSVATEFLLLGKPVVTFKTRTPAGHVLDIRRPAMLSVALEKALGRPQALMAAAQAFVAEMHPYTDGRSSERVLDAVGHFKRHHAGRLPAKPLNLWRKLKVYRRMGRYRPF